MPMIKHGYLTTVCAQRIPANSVHYWNSWLMVIRSQQRSVKLWLLVSEWGVIDRLTDCLTDWGEWASQRGRQCVCEWVQTLQITEFLSHLQFGAYIGLILGLRPANERRRYNQSCYTLYADSIFIVVTILASILPTSCSIPLFTAILHAMFNMIKANICFYTASVN